MPKEFYTERDIEDMVKRGILSLELNDQVVMTDLAYEKANKLGMRLVREKPDNPPAAPVRPYLAQPPSQTVGVGVPVSSSIPPGSSPIGSQVIPAVQTDGEDIHQRIRSAVISRLGSQVDANLLDVIITRVLQNTGVK
ncbi:MAG TPA: hypothetical protein VN452_02710 [Longilinea sp.]|nr:hypothetical protein [Longilinea sp.]